MIKLIYIKDNKPQISYTEKIIGVTGNNGFDIRQFAIPLQVGGNRMSDFSYSIKIQPFGKPPKSAYYDFLYKNIIDNYIILTWVIKASNLSEAGNLNFSIQMVSPDKSIVNETIPDTFIVEKGISPDESLFPPSVFEMAAREAMVQANRAKDEADRAAELAKLVADMIESINKDKEGE